MNSETQGIWADSDDEGQKLQGDWTPLRRLPGVFIVENVVDGLLVDFHNLLYLCFKWCDFFCYDSSGSWEEMLVLTRMLVMGDFLKVSGLYAQEWPEPLAGWAHCGSVEDTVFFKQVWAGEESGAAHALRT